MTAAAASGAAGADLGELRDIALAIAREAGGLLAGGWSGVTVADTKSSPTDVVTAMDRASEALIGRRLTELRPDDGLLAEEGSNRPAPSGLEWVVDPLDGTVNYLYGLPFWSVSIAAREVGAADRSLVGVVHAPALGKTWTAIAGAGSFRVDAAGELTGDPLHGSPATELAQALVGTGFDYRADWRARQAEVVLRVLPRVRDIRRLGSAAVDLCLCAEGVLDAYYEQSLNPWDVGAGALVAREAGLIVSGLDGRPSSSALTIAAPPALHRQLAELLAEEPRADRT